MIFIIRPEPGLQSSLQAARDMALPAVGLPLFEVFPRQWDAPDASAFDGLLIGSANAMRYGGDALQAYVDLPVYAVGQATADVATEAGFSVASTGEGGLQNLLDGIDKPMRLLRLAGVERVALNVPKGTTITLREIYEVRALPITGSAQVGLRAGDPLVLLHSAAAAGHFANEVNRLGLDRAAIRIACIGPRVAQAAGSGWSDIQSAPQPSDAALLELARNMCH